MRKRAPENTLEIVEKNIKALHERQDPLDAADLRRLEMLVNIRRILLINGTDSESAEEKYTDVSDEEIISELSKPESKIKVPRKPRGKKAKAK